MSTDDLPEGRQGKVQQAGPGFRWRATTADGDKPLSVGLADRLDIAVAVRVSPQEPSDRQKEKLHRQKEWDRLDREYAKINLKNIASVQPVKFGVHPAAAPRSIEYWTWWQVLFWIKHRCREKLKVTGTSWYDDDARLRLTVAIQRGEIDCVDPDSWLKVPQHRAFDREREPNVLFRADDVIALWPAAFLQPFPEVVAEYYRRSGKSPSSEDGSPEVPNDIQSLAISQNNQPPLSNEKEAVVEPITRSKLKAIVAFIKRGDRPKGKYKESFPRPKGGVSRMAEFAYRVLLQVLPDRRDQHNAEVTKRRNAKADRENLFEKTRGTLSSHLSSNLQSQSRKFEVGFKDDQIRHLLLQLENNEHPWLIEGKEMKRLLDTPGCPPPDIDNDLCEALPLDIANE
jgi:hypothetical protein